MERPSVCVRVYMYVCASTCVHVWFPPASSPHHGTSTYSNRETIFTGRLVTTSIERIFSVKNIYFVLNGIQGSLTCADDHKAVSNIILMGYTFASHHPLLCCMDCLFLHFGTSIPTSFNIWYVWWPRSTFAFFVRGSPSFVARLFRSCFAVRRHLCLAFVVCASRFVVRGSPSYVPRVFRLCFTLQSWTVSKHYACTSLYVLLFFIIQKLVIILNPKL